MIHVTDWYPSLIRLAGGQSVTDRDGIDLYDILFGPGHGSTREEFVYNIAIDATYGITQGAIRFRNWKLIRTVLNENEFKDSLYDIENDPSEKQDLSGDNQEIVSMMLERFEVFDCFSSRFNVCYQNYSFSRSLRKAWRPMTTLLRSPMVEILTKMETFKLVGVKYKFIQKT